ncbi:DNA polymerase III subunit epsilon [Boudabousia tangfeifanii]|uniref:DNA polymerase III subunit epsilon n=1 Tax=Boudabousia tangfeifanii TaxID=1912795 RepID=A0A1D9MMG7_9ACTO|nr:DNA polymerase III subunit epsilon [Boudabousia tangfeifanii]
MPTPAQLLVPSFVAVDFETANRAGAESACQIALVSVVEGQIAGRYTTYLLPPEEYGHFEFTYLHGIDEETVANAPTWHEVAEDIADFVDQRPVYAHNASFDQGVWRALDRYYQLETMPPEFYCSYRTAQKLVPNLINYKLPTVVHALDPAFNLDHHQADSDAEACARIIIALQQKLKRLGY